MNRWTSRTLIAIPLALVVTGLAVPALSGDGSHPAPVLAPAPSSPGTSWVAPASPSRGQGSASAPVPGRQSSSPTFVSGTVPAVTSQLVTAGTTVPSSTQVVTPLSGPVPLHSSPSGPVTGSLAPTTYGGPTWVPVLSTSGTCDQVQLPTSPNGSTRLAGGLGGQGGQYSVGGGGVTVWSVDQCL